MQDHLDGAHLAAEWESVVVRSLGIEAAVVRQAGPERIGVQPRRRGRWIEEETLATDDLEEQILRDVAVQGRGRIRRAQPESRVPPRSVPAVLRHAHVIAQFGDPVVPRLDEIGIRTLSALQDIEVVPESHRPKGDACIHVGAQSSLPGRDHRDEAVGEPLAQAGEGPVRPGRPVRGETVDQHRHRSLAIDLEPFDRRPRDPLDGERPWRAAPMDDPHQGVEQIAARPDAVSAACRKPAADYRLINFAVRSHLSRSARFFLNSV